MCARWVRLSIVSERGLYPIWASPSHALYRFRSLDEEAELWVGFCMYDTSHFSAIISDVQVLKDPTDSQLAALRDDMISRASHSWD